MSKDAFDVKTGKFFRFDPDELLIVTDKADPMYDPREALPVDDALVANIMYQLQGVLEPVIVYKDGGRAVVCDGRQRVKAAREANKRLRAQGIDPITVPCIYRPGTHSNLFSIMVSTNEFRRNDSPIEKAEKINRFLVHGGSKAEAAGMYGVSVQTIQNWLSLLDLAPEVAAQVKAKEITASAAVKIAKVPRKEQSKVAKERTSRAKRYRLRDEVVAMVESTKNSVVRDTLLWVLCETDVILADSKLK